MKVDQKSYAQVIVAERSDFILGSIYDQYEAVCPFLCFPGMFAGDFRGSVREPEAIVKNKDVILVLRPYWDLLETEEQKAVLDHELGHISEGHLKRIEEKIRRTGRGGSGEPDLTEEMEADAYSASLNGNKAIYHALHKVLDVMMGPYRKKGHNITIDYLLKHDHVMAARLKRLKEQIDGQSAEGGESKEETAS